MSLAFGTFDTPRWLGWFSNCQDGPFHFLDRSANRNVTADGIDVTGEKLLVVLQQPLDALLCVGVHELPSIKRA